MTTKHKKTYYHSSSNRRLLPSVTGKIETLAQFLAMRFAKRSCWRPCYSNKVYYKNYNIGESSLENFCFNFFHGDCFLKYTSSANKQVSISFSKIS